MVKLPNFIKKVRGDRSQGVFGATIGVSQQTVVDWENGKIPNSFKAAIKFISQLTPEQRAQLFPEKTKNILAFASNEPAKTSA